MSKGNLLDMIKFGTEKLTVIAMVDMVILIFFLLFSHSKARQASAGMAYLEEKKIVHRDLSLSTLK
jgi:hypothetical protein